MSSDDKFANLICDILVGKKTLEDYAADLGEIRLQMSTTKKLYGNGSKEVQELEGIATMIKSVIRHKLYDDKVDEKGSSRLSVVK